MVQIVFRSVRKIIVGTVGGLIVVVGIILVPLPGPGLIIMLGGLMLLSTEFPRMTRYRDLALKKVSDLIRSIRSQYEHSTQLHEQTDDRGEVQMSPKKM